MDFWLDVSLTTGAAAVEAAFGYPDALFRAVRHPVVWIGALIGWLEARLNLALWAPVWRRASGMLTLLVVLLAAVVPAAIVQSVVGRWPFGVVVLAVLASAWPAQRSLWSHVSAVANALEREGVEGGRLAVSRIVGRDPAALDEAGVVRAAIESLAENFADGVVAPLFWGVVAGLPGMAGYKAANTADSMIGHRNDRYAAFGWAAARFDDVINLPASRLSALLLAMAAALAGANAAGAWRAVWRDARRHRSPNAGWPEAAMAGSLGLRLAGPRIYGGRRVEDGWMGDGRAVATTADLRRALRLYRVACGMLLSLLVILAGVTWF